MTPQRSRDRVATHSRHPMDRPLGAPLDEVHDRIGRAARARHGRLSATASLRSERPNARRRGPWRPPNPQPPSGLGPEKDLACKTAPQEPLRLTAAAASKPGRTQDSLEMARPRLELGTPRFSGTPERRRLPPKVPANRRVRDRAVQPASPRIPAVPSGFRTSQHGRGPKRRGTPAGTGQVARSRAAHIGCCEHVRVVGRASARGTGPAFPRPRPNDTTRLLAPFRQRPAQRGEQRAISRLGCGLPSWRRAIASS